jgi:hypothetical protein
MCSYFPSHTPKVVVDGIRNDMVTYSEAILGYFPVPHSLPLSNDHY